MGKVKVLSFSISVDGYGAGVCQDLTHPMGLGGKDLHAWAFQTKTFQTMFGQTGGGEGVDESFAAKGMQNLGAWILGRNMFSPYRGPWKNDEWKGWWGETPPYRVPVFVLTHHPRPPLEMNGGTTFHFVTDGIEVALEQARAAAGGKDIRIGGGVETVRAYLKARLIDELHLVVAPVCLGKGENIWQGIDLPTLGYTVKEQVKGENAVHLIIEKI